jgi:protein-disulfide isomerase
MKPLLATVAILAFAPAAIVPAHPVRAQAQRDWSRVVAQTPEGGFRMGNPEAAIRIVEFVWLTCPHCAHFAEEGAPQLIRDHVRSGRVSLEYRNFVLNAYDLAAALLSRCAAPEDYFALNHAILGSQSQWVGRVESLSADQRQQLQNLQPIQGMQRIVAWTGLDAIAARHGITAAEARTCLANQAGLDRIIQMREAGNAAGVNGTPSFAINGRMAEAHDWATLEPLLRAAR